MPKQLRFEVFIAKIDQFKEQTLGSTPAIYQGSPASFAFALFDQDEDLIPIAERYTDLTLEVWADRDSGARLLQETVAAAQFDATCELADWTAKTKAPVVFDLTGTQLNFAVAAGKTQATFYMVIGGTPTVGEPETLGYATLTVLKDRFGEPGETVEADPASYLTAAQSDARYVPFEGGAYFRFAGGLLQIRDKDTGGWRGLFFESGVLAWTAEDPAAVEGDALYRFAGNFIQLGDTVTGGWRSIWLESGVLVWGAEEAL